MSMLRQSFKQALVWRTLAGVGLVLWAVSSPEPAFPETMAADPSAMAFGQMPTLWDVDLSPDGSKISYLTHHNSGTPIAVVWELEGGKPHVLLASQPDGAKLNWCKWANNERLLCSYLKIPYRSRRQQGLHELFAAFRVLVDLTSDIVD